MKTAFFIVPVSQLIVGLLSWAVHGKELRPHYAKAALDLQEKGPMLFSQTRCQHLQLNQEPLRCEGIPDLEVVFERRADRLQDRWPIICPNIICELRWQRFLSAAQDIDSAAFTSARGRATAPSSSTRSSMAACGRHSRASGRPPHYRPAPAGGRAHVGAPDSPYPTPFTNLAPIPPRRSPIRWLHGRTSEVPHLSIEATGAPPPPHTHRPTDRKTHSHTGTRARPRAREAASDIKGATPTGARRPLILMKRGTRRAIPD